VVGFLRAFSLFRIDPGGLFVYKCKRKLCCTALGNGFAQLWEVNSAKLTASRIRLASKFPDDRNQFQR
jgi:hypothetical protein